MRPVLLPGVVFHRGERVHAAVRREALKSGGTRAHAVDDGVGREEPGCFAVAGGGFDVLVFLLGGFVLDDGGVVVWEAGEWISGGW